MLMKVCSRCGKKIVITETCSCTKERHKIYDREYRNKKLCKLQANGLDMYELEVNGKIVKGTLSHHIEELEDNKDRALDITNLIWVSEKTHNYIHSVYNKSKEDKNKLKALLFKIINKKI